MPDEYDNEAALAMVVDMGELGLKCLTTKGPLNRAVASYQLGIFCLQMHALMQVRPEWAAPLEWVLRAAPPTDEQADGTIAAIRYAPKEKAS